MLESLHVSTRFRNIIADAAELESLIGLPSELVIKKQLRINGRACVIRDDEILASMAINGKQPVVGIVVEVEECYFQCVKALIRSKLWDNVTKGPRCAEFDFAQILADQTQVEGQCVESLKQQIEVSYKERLY